MNSPFKNFSRVARSPLRKAALSVYLAGLRAVMPQKVIPQALRLEGRVLLARGRAYQLAQGRLVVIGGGKGASLMAKVAEEVLGPENVSAGCVIDQHINLTTSKVKVMRGGHPIPDREGVTAVGSLLAMTDGLSERDVVVCLFSGGGSSLMTCPAEGVSLEDLQNLNRLLLFSGAPVSEVNIVRKHLSRISGGQLARHLYPASVVSLAISDTLDPAIDATASGPTLPDRSTFSMALEVLHRYGLHSEAPCGVIDRLEGGLRGRVPETPKEGDPILARAQYIVMAENKDALQAMAGCARSLDFETRTVTSPLTAPVQRVAQAVADEIRQIPRGRKACLLAGGEATVVVRGAGKGGRCQELAALMSSIIEGPERSVFLAAATDGCDYLTGVGGAMVDNKTRRLAGKRGLILEDFLNSNDTYAYHEALGNLLLTHPTGTNVCDVMVYLCDPH